MIAATVLAAGESIRMGSPKALLEYRGRTFIETILDTMETVGVEPRVIVTRSSLLNRLSSYKLRDVRIITSEEPGAGPVGSVRTAIRHLSDTPVNGLLIWPVDLPRVLASTVSLILARGGGHQIAIPRFGQRRGHPVFIKREVFPEILQLSLDRTLRDVMRADPDRVCEIPVHDVAVIDNMNSPADYRRLLGQTDDGPASDD